MASSFARASWYGARLRAEGFVDGAPVNLGWEDNYQAGIYKREWNGRHQELLETFDTPFMARSHHMSLKRCVCVWGGAVLIILSSPLSMRRSEHPRDQCGLIDMEESGDDES